MSMTPSETYKRRAEEIQPQLDKLHEQLNIINQTIDSLSIEQEYWQKEYQTAYNEELTARRSYVPEECSPTIPNATPHAESLTWSRLQKRVTGHPKYRWETQLSQPWVHRLLLSLARFNQTMLAITNRQAWNARNPNPHLP